jgi:hypothetical protein
MDTKTLAQHIKIPLDEVERLLELSMEGIYSDEGYQALLKSLNRPVLEETLPEARAAYEAGLPQLKVTLAKKYKVDTEPMSPNTLGNWVITALRSSHNLEQMIKHHERVPGEMILGGLPDVLNMVSHIHEGSSEWQRALCILSLPLIKMESKAS